MKSENEEHRKSLSQVTSREAINGDPAQISSLFSAISKAQATVGKVAKNSDNPFFKSQYADLSACREAIRETFGKHGLAVIQLLDSKICSHVIAKCVTIIAHSDGGWIESTSSCGSADASPQKLGSAWTYLRRYSLAAAAGLAQADDDGNTQREAYSSKADVSQLYDLASDHEAFQADGMFDEWVERLKGKPPSDLTKSEADRLITFLKKDRTKWPKVAVKAHEAVYATSNGSGK